MSARFAGSDVPCVCQHAQAEHQPDCQVPIGSIQGADTFCACSSYRAPKAGPLEAELLLAARRALDDEWMPAWTARARCRSANLRRGDDAIGPQTPGNLWRWSGVGPSPYSDDQFADKNQDGDEGDSEIEASGVPKKTAEEFMRDACAPCPVRRECLHYAYEEVDRGRRYGVYGGVPGRKREHLTEVKANAWFVALALREGWLKTDREEETA